MLDFIVYALSTLLFLLGIRMVFVSWKTRKDNFSKACPVLSSEKLRKLLLVRFFLSFLSTWLAVSWGYLFLIRLEVILPVLYMGLYWGIVEFLTDKGMEIGLKQNF